MPSTLRIPCIHRGWTPTVGNLSLLQGISPTRDQTQVSCIAGGYLKLLFDSLSPLLPHFITPSLQLMVIPHSS